MQLFHRFICTTHLDAPVSCPNNPQSLRRGTHVCMKLFRFHGSERFEITGGQPRPENNLGVLCNPPL
jgi:hypothetical protein